MKTNLRLNLLIAGASLAPVLVFAVCAAGFGLGYPCSILIAALPALLSAFFASRQVAGGLILPMARMASGVRSFVKADYRLDSTIPKEGWPEAGNLVSALNRVLLELSAYRAFHLNQLVDERAKAQALIETITDGILLADDCGRLIYSNQIALKLLGIPRQEALELLGGTIPDFMVLDVSMPEMSGTEFIVELKRLAVRKPELNDIPFVVMTGENSMEAELNKVFASARGFVSYFPKLTPPESVLEKAEETLRGRL